ncbi:MAG: DUF4179 domain-containing protein [Defluviitaleaceae bacterium]|nr:DUF4179 domain-containing protein [Defluviitaleaceae bacterium]MCL2238573.1 DUF4179 domain-containing protein [Defluviitaleaceae bacterium]
MNRQQEYQELLLELENTPKEMSQMSANTKIRARKRTILRSTLIPPGLFLAMLCMVTLAVNTSPTIAYAFERIPVLRQIAVAVNFNPSLTVAIEHEFIQRIDLAQTIGDITMRVEYVIVDQRQLNIFYTLSSPTYAYLNSWRPAIFCAEDETHLPVSISSGPHTQSSGAIRQTVVNFFDGQMPDTLVFEMLVLGVDTAWMYAEIPEPVQALPQREYTEPADLIAFVFTLAFDPGFTEQGKILYLYQDFTLADQRMVLTSVEIYPTHMRINLAADPSNTAWLRSLHFFAENERGERFDTISNGITAFGAVDSPTMASHLLHSPFFAQSEALTLYIKGVEWLDKDMQRVRVDLANGIAQRLPEGVTLDEARWDGQSWHLSFAVIERAPNHNHQIFGQDFFNEAGEAFRFNAWSSGIRFHSSPGYDAPNVFFVQFALADFPYDIVYLTPAYSRVATLVAPVALRLR